MSKASSNIMHHARGVSSLRAFFSAGATRDVARKRACRILLERDPEKG
jgi:hypothetical protein